MTAGTAVLLLLAGTAAGAVNAVVGAGTLISYPALLAVGLAPVPANATNTTGLSVGSFSSAWGYRRELAGRMRMLLAPGAAALVCGAVGAGLVLALPEKVFAAAVPWLIGAAAVLVAIQPRVVRWLRSRRTTDQPHLVPHGEASLTAAVGASGVYGGYFGAAQGVILMAVLGTLYDPDLQRANGAKNLFAGCANITAALVFVLAGRVDWGAAVALALGALVGGTLGARWARRLPPGWMRAAVVAVGAVACLSLLVRR